VSRGEFEHWLVSFLADDFGYPQAEEAVIGPVVDVTGGGGLGRAAGGESAARWGWSGIVVDGGYFVGD
jgi:hypothetical protein